MLPGSKINFLGPVAIKYDDDVVLEATVGEIPLDSRRKLRVPLSLPREDEGRTKCVAHLFSPT